MSQLRIIPKTSITASGISKKASNKPSKRIRTKQSDVQKPITQRTVQYEISSLDIKGKASAYQKVKKQNKILLAFSIILAPIIIPTVIMVIKMLSNKKAMNQMAEKFGPKSINTQAFEPIIANNFVVKIDQTLESGKKQLARDITGGIRIAGRSISKEVFNLINQDKYHKFFKNFQSSAPKSAKEINETMIQELQELVLKDVVTSGNDVIQAFLTKDIVETVITKDALFDLLNEEDPIDIFSGNLRDAFVTKDSADKIVAKLLPKLESTQIEGMIKNYAQQVFYQVKYIFNENLIMEAGVALSLNDRFDLNIFQAEDGSIKAIAKVDSLFFKSLTGGEHIEIDNQAEVHMTLTDEGFVIKDIIFSDQKVANLVFAKGQTEINAALKDMGVIA